MNTLPYIWEALFNSYLAVAPEKLQTIVQVLGPRLGVDINFELTVNPEALSPDANRFDSKPNYEDRNSLFSSVDGVAHVPIIGSLVNRGAWVGARSGLTSYEGIDAQIRQAVSDPKINAIVLDINSPGGEATGMSTLAATIRSARDVKPVIASVNDVAASAAYGIASAATEIVVSPTSLIGSIGVVYLHLDESAKMQAEGVKPTMIFAGDRKVDGASYAPLSDTALSEIQSRVFKFYDQFLQSIAAGRGERFGVDAARGTQARVLMGEEAVQIGMADRVASFAQVMDQFRSSPRRGNTQRSKTMTTNANTDDAGVQAQISTAVSAALATERARISAILTCEEAKGREQQAMTLAMEPAMSVESAKKLLASFGTATTIAGRAAGMPEAGANAGQPPSTAQAAGSLWGSAVANVNQRVA